MVLGDGTARPTSLAGHGLGVPGWHEYETGAGPTAWAKCPSLDVGGLGSHPTPHFCCTSLSATCELTPNLLARITLDCFASEPVPLVSVLPYSWEVFE